MISAGYNSPSSLLLNNECFFRVYPTVQELVGRELSLFYKLVVQRPENPFFLVIVPKQWKSDNYIDFHCTISLATFRNWQNMLATLLCSPDFEPSGVKKKWLGETKSNKIMRRKNHAWLCGLALIQIRGHSLSPASVQPTVSLGVRIIRHCTSADIPLWYKEWKVTENQKETLFFCCLFVSGCVHEEMQYIFFQKATFTELLKSR